MSSQGIFLIGGVTTVDHLGATYRRAFQAIGQSVDGFDMEGQAAYLAWPGRSRLLHRLTIGSLQARRIWSRRLNAKILDTARASPSHWVLLLNGGWIMPETVRSLKQLGKRVAIFHADNPFPPNSANRPETLEAALEADLYLIWSHRLVQKLLEIGVKRAAFMPFGWDPEIFPYHGEMMQGAWPGALFIGGWDREREEFLDEVASHVPLRIYGPGYWGTRARKRGRAKRCWRGGGLTMSAAARTIRESAVSLNILRTQHVIDGAPDGLIMRHFEVPGAGGFLLSTRSGGATELFPERDTAAYFADARECIEMCKHYIHAVDERSQIVERGHAEVASRHTYADRAREIVALLETLG